MLKIIWEKRCFNFRQGLQLKKKEIKKLLKFINEKSIVISININKIFKKIYRLL